MAFTPPTQRALRRTTFLPLHTSAPHAPSPPAHGVPTAWQRHDRDSEDENVSECDAASVANRLLEEDELSEAGSAIVSTIELEEEEVVAAELEAEAGFQSEEHKLQEMLVEAMRQLEELKEQKDSLEKVRRCLPPRAMSGLQPLSWSYFTGLEAANIEISRSWKRSARSGRRTSRQDFKKLAAERDALQTERNRLDVLVQTATATNVALGKQNELLQSERTRYGETVDGLREQNRVLRDGATRLRASLDVLAAGAGFAAIEAANTEIDALKAQLETLRVSNEETKKENAAVREANQRVSAELVALEEELAVYLQGNPGPPADGLQLLDVSRTEIGSSTNRAGTDVEVDALPARIRALELENSSLRDPRLCKIISTLADRMAQLPELEIGFTRPAVADLVPICGSADNLFAILGANATARIALPDILHLRHRTVFTPSPEGHLVGFGPRAYFDSQTQSFATGVPSDLLRMWHEKKVKEVFVESPDRRYTVYAGTYAFVEPQAPCVTHLWRFEDRRAAAPEELAELAFQGPVPPDWRALVHAQFGDKGFKVEAVGMRCVGFDWDLYRALVGSENAAVGLGTVVEVKGRPADRGDKAGTGKRMREGGEGEEGASAGSGSVALLDDSVVVDEQTAQVKKRQRA
ncbi:hypothetical protein HMN09_01211500 [Mycena chlorophos]|uniref:Uncharacterized protein n=1 Tax=Mycena chlorophos TaxID=658473 RepID=A0A8H6S8N4_MYCCL|nr:hypothetical protein HMN09_01211500 [Mycena chlorophos]